MLRSIIQTLLNWKIYQHTKAWQKWTGYTTCTLLWHWIDMYYLWWPMPSTNMFWSIKCRFYCYCIYMQVTIYTISQNIMIEHTLHNNHLIYHENTMPNLAEKGSQPCNCSSKLLHHLCHGPLKVFSWPYLSRKYVIWSFLANLQESGLQKIPVCDNFIESAAKTSN